jgi:sorbitol/mannitol transport system permease protein
MVPALQPPLARANRQSASWLALPAIALLAIGSVGPLLMTLWFSFQHYSLVNPDMAGFAGIENYRSLAGDPAFWASLRNTAVLVGSVLVLTVAGGVLLAVLFDQSFPGRSIARLLAIAPFFVMPAVSALLWKNLILHPVYGILGILSRSSGRDAVDWFANYPMVSLVLILTWEWLPFALLILLTALQSLDQEQREAARMDGAGPLAQFSFITLPHLGRAISVVIMMEAIFLLAVFVEIFVTTSGGPGTATTNLAFLIYGRALLEFDVGGASAGGVVATLFANLAAIALARTVSKRLAV